MKKIFSIIFCFISVISYSQLSVNSIGTLTGVANTILLTTTDSVQFLAKRDTGKLANGVRNSINTTASNGLTKIGDNITLGGILNTPTTFTISATNYFQLLGLQQGGATDSLLVSVSNSGIIKRVSLNQIIDGAGIYSENPASGRRLVT
jgi:hypothetical protein